MVKQIRNGELVGKLIDRGDGYFHWLQRKSGLSGRLSGMLADTVFVSLDGIDDVLRDKAKEETRRAYAEDILEEDGNADAKKVEEVIKSVRGDCCLFEVIFCLADTLSGMFEDDEKGTEHFFWVLIRNAGFALYDDEDLDNIGTQVEEYWQRCIKRVLERSYDDNGRGGLFPLEWVEDYRDDRKTYSDRRFISLWQQMNDWVDQHTNEDGEWVD